MELEKINGNEILKYLNESINEHDDLCDVSLCRPLEFELQKIEKDIYCLNFTAYFNNWGTYQAAEDNHIRIYPDGDIKVWLSEAFEGDGSSEAIEDFLKLWLGEHKFNSNSNQEEDWTSIMRDIYEQLPQIGFNDPSSMQEQIDKLVEAKTYMK